MATTSRQHAPRSWKYEAPPPDAYTDPDIMLDEDVVFWIVEEQGAGEVLALVTKVVDDSEANARMMAAAPELLAALKQIVEHEQIDDFGIRYTFDNNSPFRESARAAIAKAEGR